MFKLLVIYIDNTKKYYIAYVNKTGGAEKSVMYINLT